MFVVYLGLCVVVSNSWGFADRFVPFRWFVCCVLFYCLMILYVAFGVDCLNYYLSLILCG